MLTEVKNKAPRLMKRIATFIDRFDFDESEVIQKIECDAMFAAHFAKEPRRTTLHENIAAVWLQELDDVHNFQKLPASGRSAIGITSDGNIVKFDRQKVPGKSLDFQWTTGNITCYAMHKYTKEEGGNQDSQYTEMLNLMKRFHQCTDENVVLIVIVDGAYYTDNGEKKLKELQHQQRTNSPLSYATPIGGVPDILKQLNANSIPPARSTL